MAGLTLRRSRLSRATRALTREIRPSHEQFIQPHFVVEGLRERTPIPALSDVHRETAESLVRQVEQDLEAGADKILLFGVPAAKGKRNLRMDFTASQIESLRREFGDALWIAVDVCLCSYTEHGHCGVVDEHHSRIANGASVAELVRAASAFASAGADCVAPSDMMDGRVGAIRTALDENDQDDVLLLSYSAKFDSGFYGPFRLAADSAPRPGRGVPKDRASYQIDPGRPRDALRCAQRDAAEGADILMVKPALPYLDVLSRLSGELALTWAAYQTSGEYGAIELLAEAGLTDRRRTHREAWTAMVRAGAQVIVSYGARHARNYLSDE